MANLLIIDDNAGIRQMLVRRLKKAGYGTFTADGPRSAQKLLEEEEIDLILLDYMMPEKNGLTFFKEIQPQYQIPVILVTAHASLDLGLEFLKAGGADFIPKPIEMVILEAKITMALEKFQNISY